MKKVLVLGGGAGGLIASNRLVKWSKGAVEVTLVDKNLYHEFRPSYLWVATGIRKPENIKRPFEALKNKKINYVNAIIKKIDPNNRVVKTTAGDLSYDYLIISLGAELNLNSSGIKEFPAPWELELALKAKENLAKFKGGEIVVACYSYPYRCPPAPFELAFLSKYISEQRGIVSNIKIAHPWKEPMEAFGPLMISIFKQFLKDFNIEFIGGFEIDNVNIKEKKIYSKKGESLKFDLAFIVPPHKVPSLIEEAGLLNKTSKYMDVEKVHLRNTKYDDIYGIGDIISSTLGIGMAGIFAHLQAEHVVSRILDDALGVYMGEHYNMGGFCIMDLGYTGAAVYCDFSPKILGKSPYPECKIIGGMKIFRLLRFSFERMWFAELFGW